MTKKLSISGVIVGVLLVLSSRGVEANYSFEPIQPIPKAVFLDKEKVSLGKQLFLDPRLSADNSISCGSCHSISSNGADNKRFSLGVGNQKGDMNTPTVFNSGSNFRQFWDGRAESLEEQVDGPTHDPKEMGSTWPEIIGKLSKDANYQQAFNDIYDGEITPANIRDAIATFERSLITPNSRFDQYLRGDKDAITQQELKGYELFKSFGCVACHQGQNVGGNMYQSFGVFGNYFKDNQIENEASFGRYNLTKNPKDKYVFKVPSLRNVVETAPYLHDGSAETLPEVVSIMAKYQVGRELSPEELSA